MSKPKKLSPQQQLAKRRESDAARARRFRERNPGYDQKWSSKRSAAMRVLKDRHRDEYREILAIMRGAGKDGNALYSEGFATLRERHADEWADILAAS